MAVNTEEEKEVCAVGTSEEEFLVSVDSGSDVTCCPTNFGGTRLEPNSAAMKMLDAKGNQIEHRGERQVSYNLVGEAGMMVPAKHRFTVSDVSKAIVSAGDIIDTGGVVHLEKNNCYMMTPVHPKFKQEMKIPLVQRKKSFYAKGVMKKMHVCPVQEEEVRHPEARGSQDFEGSALRPVVVAEEGPFAPADNRELYRCLGVLPSGSRCKNDVVDDGSEFCQLCGELEDAGRWDDGEAQRKMIEEHGVKPTGLSRDSPVEKLRSRLRELRGPIWGTKEQVYQRMIEYESKRRNELLKEVRLEERAEMARLGKKAPPMSTLEVPDPPSEEEIRQHEVTHFPIQPWCVECQMGKGIASPHKSKQEIGGSKRDPLTQLDFMFMKKDGSRAENLKNAWATTLCGVDCDTLTPIFTTVPSKKANVKYTAKTIVEFLRRMCHGKVIIRTDGEPSIVDIADRVKTIRKKKYSEDTVLEKTPRYSSQSLGVMGATQRHGQGQMRTVRLSVEKKYTAKSDRTTLAGRG